jgi:16S rRNA (uracil1498-N3)-methyltransferase
MQVFYSPAFSPDNPFLPEEESRHCVKVLRKNAGDTVQITDGRGNLFTAALVVPDARQCELRILDTRENFGRRNYRIHLAVAPTKNADRTEWLVEKCVEIGVDRISFLACERSERKVFKTDRVERIAVSAMKQSLKAYLPEIDEMQPYRTFVTREHTGEKFIAHLAEEGPRDLLVQAAPKNATYCILIGPEGDFTAEEVRLAIDYGFQPVSLGDSRLRTETAGLVACHIMHVINSF